MGSFASYDGTTIGYRTLGDGPALVCLPGGPGRTSEYFGDLGGLSRSRRLIMPDTRAGDLDTSPTAESAAAAARLFPNATVAVQPGGAHFPWLDDPAFFTTAITSFLR